MLKIKNQIDYAAIDSVLQNFAKFKSLTGANSQFKNKNKLNESDVSITEVFN